METRSNLRDFWQEERTVHAESSSLIGHLQHTAKVVRCIQGEGLFVACFRCFKASKSPIAIPGSMHPLGPGRLARVAYACLFLKWGIYSLLAQSTSPRLRIRHMMPWAHEAVRHYGKDTGFNPIGVYPLFLPQHQSLLKNYSLLPVHGAIIGQGKQSCAVLTMKQ